MKPGIWLVIFSFWMVAANAQQHYWQQQADYTINVTLNDTDHSVDGYEVIGYQNNSPDTLHFVWIHLWANAYKNDRTAFTDQLLQQGSTDFYFSDDDKKGYINRLAFKVDGNVALMEEHPRYIDVMKLYLPKPLAPGKSCRIETPFHEKLPYNISRGGHIGQSYQLTQWYPKIALYDKKGWHEMPYLDQGEYYSDFGNYEVSITLPENYVVAATGKKISETVEAAPATPSTIQTQAPAKAPGFSRAKKTALPKTPVSSPNKKTLLFQQDSVIDFAWFADKNFIVHTDTLLLPGGRIIQLTACSLPQKGTDPWTHALHYMKKAILSRSHLLGAYPYTTVTAVQANTPYGGGMEYPTITLISGSKNERALESVLEHELGHNWFYGILASNERDAPWMDEGMNTYYNKYRYAFDAEQAPVKKQDSFFEKRLPGDYGAFLLNYLTAEKKDQPIATGSAEQGAANYNAVVYYEASLWMRYLEHELGTEVFDHCMQEYYRQWRFKHPGEADFKAVCEAVSGKKLDETFALLHLAKTGNPVVRSKTATAGVFDGDQRQNEHRPVKLMSFFSLKNTDRYQYIFASPAVGYNKYNGVMIGGLLHNYTLPGEKFQFLLSPLYATGSKDLNGIGRLDYKLLQGNNGEKLVLSLAAESFNGDAYTDSTGKKNFLRFSKLAPGIRYVFATKKPGSQVLKYLQWKTFLLRETSLLFTRDTINDADIISYPVFNRYVNQLKFVVENNRVLYPYQAQLQADQGKSFVRIAFTGNYYFNYAKGGGMNVRLFAGKFFYLGEKTFIKQFETDPYQLNMTGPKGYEDYTYSNYFVGRNEFSGFANQQIMQRDGFFKVRTDLLSSKIGKTDNWLAAINFTSDFPRAVNPLQVLPIRIPLKIFVDVGTYAETWQKNYNQGKFVYDAGLQVSLFKNVLNIYMPLLYSKVYRDYINSTINGSKFLKNISFSIDVQNISLRKLFPSFAF